MNEKNNLENKKLSLQNELSKLKDIWVSQKGEEFEDNENENDDNGEDDNVLMEDNMMEDDN